MQGPFHAFAWLKLRLEPQTPGFHGPLPPPLRLSALLRSQPANPDRDGDRGRAEAPMRADSSASEPPDHPDATAAPLRLPQPWPAPTPLPERCEPALVRFDGPIF